MKRTSNASPLPNTLRKPIRRARVPQRYNRHPMPSPNQSHPKSNSDSPIPASPNPNHAWRHHEILAIAQAIHKAGHTDPTALFGGSDASLPESLTQKSRQQVNDTVEHLGKVFDKSTISFAPDKSLPNYLAVLASEISFMKNQTEERDSALAVLNKARSERKLVERKRQRLVAESKALTKQIQEERTRRTKAVEKKVEEEAKLENERSKLEDERQNYERLRETLDVARYAELDIRRRLDRMRLQVAAMRGEMIIPTVDKLFTRNTPKWLGEFDDSLISGASDPQNTKDKDGTSQVAPKPAGEKQEVQMKDIVATEDIESPAHSVKDDLELDDSNEEIEFQLLKNRLAMCEMEAKEWKQCVEYERQKVRLIMRSKGKLEEELSKLKHGGGNKSSGSGSGRGVGKSGSASNKAAAKLRAAVRASLPPALDGGARKPIRKSRKGKPKRALVPEVL